MTTFHQSKYASGTSVDAALDKAVSALQPGDVVNALNSTSTSAPLAAAQGKELNDSKLAASGGTIGAYAETGATLTPVSGVLTIPLDGRHYQCTPTANITSIVLSDVPTAQKVGEATVYFIYSSAARAIASPTSWEWPNKFRSLTATKSGYTVRLDIWSTPMGTIGAATLDTGVPA